MRSLALRLGLKFSPRDEKSPGTVGGGLPATAVTWEGVSAIEWDTGNTMKWE